MYPISHLYLDKTVFTIVRKVVIITYKSKNSLSYYFQLIISIIVFLLVQTFIILLSTFTLHFEYYTAYVGG